MPCSYGDVTGPKPDTPWRVPTRKVIVIVKSSSRPTRKITRLPEFDYTQPGAYFLTICCAKRVERFGAICDQAMALNPVGEIARACWREIPVHYPQITLDEFIVMPNHVHGILWIGERPLGVSGNMRRTFGKSIKGSISTVVGSYKSAVTYTSHEQGMLTQVRLWQGRFWEHVVRNEADLERIRTYIRNNPARWLEDQLHPQAPPNRFNIA